MATDKPVQSSLWDTPADPTCPPLWHAPAISAQASAQCRHEQIELANGRLDLFTGIFTPAHADQLLSELSAQIAWRQDYLQLAGRRIAVPRLQAWYGDPGADYAYSGISLQPLPWIPALQQIRQRLLQLTGQAFNSVLCNLYRNGQDSVSWHADDERELGSNPSIASVSFGATRRFQLKPKRGRGNSFNLDLPHNSLLLMSGALQHHWIHQLPKTRQAVAPRINLTFRRILAPVTSVQTK